MDIFYQACRKAIRFSTSSGIINTEDLFNLSLQSLDKIAKGLNKELKDSEEESFIKTRSSSNSLLQLKFDIVIFIINEKLKETEAKKEAAEKAAKRETLKALLAQKQVESLNALTAEEIEKQLKELE